MTIYNLGSINLDHVYQLEHMPAPGETLAAKDYSVNLGGKGFNISVALHRAGARVRHIGAVQEKDGLVQNLLKEFALDQSAITPVETATGHAIIYVDSGAENQIVIYPGANAAITEEQVDHALADAQPGDWLVLQNETNANQIGLKAARARGMKVALVAAPFDGTLPALIEQVDLVSLNETELAAFELAIGAEFHSRPEISFLVTYGSNGAEFVGNGRSTRVAAHKVNAVDTTGAGDTFFGGFMAKYASGGDVKRALEFASAMAALQVQSHGAAVAIPAEADVIDFLNATSD